MDGFSGMILDFDLNDFTSKVPLKAQYVLSIGGRSTLTLINVLVYTWEGEKYACVYLIGVSPFVVMKTRHFIMGQTIVLKITSSKMVKYEKTCYDNQDAFNHLFNNVMFFRTINVIFNMINFEIKKNESDV